MTGPERKALLQHMAALATDADAVDLPSRVFLPLDSHRLALRPEIVVVEGSRGAGKTALFHLLNHLGNEIGAFFQDRSIPAARWVDAYSEHIDHPSPSVLDHLVAAIDGTSDARCGPSGPCTCSRGCAPRTLPPLACPPMWPRATTPRRMISSAGSPSPPSASLP